MSPRETTNTSSCFHLRETRLDLLSSTFVLKHNLCFLSEEILFQYSYMQLIRKLVVDTLTEGLIKT